MITVLETLSNTVAELMREDPRRVVLGEDVTDGGMLGLTRAAADDEALAPRLLGLPLQSAAGIAHAAGLALGGARPVMLMPSVATLVEGLSALREASRFSRRFDTDRALPLLIVAPFGPGFGLGGDGAMDATDLLTCIDGLRVVVGSDPARFSELLRAAAAFDAGESPTVLLFPRNLLLREAAPDPEEGEQPELAPMDQARVVMDGSDATVFCWGATVERVCEAVDGAELTARVVDLVSLRPMDHAGVLDAARETGRVLVVGAGAHNHGPAAQLSALLAEEGITFLDAPVRHLRGRAGDVEARHEHDLIPSVDRIRDALNSTASF